MLGLRLISNYIKHFFAFLESPMWIVQIMEFVLMVNVLAMLCGWEMLAMNQYVQITVLSRNKEVNVIMKHTVVTALTVLEVIKLYLLINKFKNLSFFRERIAIIQCLNEPNFITLKSREISRF